MERFHCSIACVYETGGGGEQINTKHKLKSSAWVEIEPMIYGLTGKRFIYWANSPPYFF